MPSAWIRRERARAPRRQSSHIARTHARIITPSIAVARDPHRRSHPAANPVAARVSKFPTVDAHRRHPSIDSIPTRARSSSTLARTNQPNRTHRARTIRLFHHLRLVARRSSTIVDSRSRVASNANSNSKINADASRTADARTRGRVTATATATDGAHA